MENYYRIPPLPQLYEGQGDINPNTNTSNYNQMMDTRQRTETSQYVDNRHPYSTINTSLPVQMNYTPRVMNYGNIPFPGNSLSHSVVERKFNMNSGSAQFIQTHSEHIKSENSTDFCDYETKMVENANSVIQPELTKSIDIKQDDNKPKISEYSDSNQNKLDSEQSEEEEGTEEETDVQKSTVNADSSRKSVDAEDDDDTEMESTDEIDKEKDSQSLEESDIDEESLRKEVSCSQASIDLTVKTCIRCKAMFTSMTDKSVTLCKDDDFICQSCTESSSEDCVKDMTMNLSYGEKNTSVNIRDSYNKGFGIKLHGLEKSNGNLVLEIFFGKKTEKIDISRDDLTQGEISINFDCQKQIIRPFIPPHLRQFPCSDCGDSFLETHSLSDHKLTHPSLKPWVCLECGKEFKYNNIMQRHKLSHTNIREHICPICEKAFRTKANMKRHKRSAHKDIPDEEPAEETKLETPIKVLPRKCKRSSFEENRVDELDDDMDDIDDAEEIYDSPDNEKRYLESIPRRPRHSTPGIKAAPLKIRYHCKMCKKGFNNKGKWKRHELYHFQMRMPVCELCGKSFVDKDYLMEHVRTHEDVFTEYICKECGMEFPFKDELQHHILGHSSPDETVATNNSDLQANLAQNGSGTFTCPDCHKCFRSNYILQRHVVTHNRATCQCQECGKFYSCRYNLVQHMMIHNTNNNYICDQCGESFKVKQYLSRHMIKHREQKTWACNLCDLKFYRQGNLRHHMKQHVEEKPYQCTHCQKSFVREKTLEEHILLTHTKERPFQCPVCGRGFGLQRMIKPHMKIHSDYKEHKCEECGKLFTYKSNLNQHMMVHSGEKPFICQYCGKGFARNKYLNDHMRTHISPTTTSHIPPLPGQPLEPIIPLPDTSHFSSNSL